MTKRIKKPKFPSELRLDLISGDWVVIATGRAKKPNAFKRKRITRKLSKKDCPFCKIETQKKPVLIYSNNKKLQIKDKIPKNWTTIVIPNLYPAFFPSESLEQRIEGNLYQRINGVGFHEILVTRDHKKTLAYLTIKEIKEVFDAYQSRYLSLMKEKFVNYVSIFHNHGIRAGASQPHPHSQIITTPLIDVDLRRALISSGKYYKKHKKCVYCEMSKWERKTKERIVFENKDFLVICPFASKSAFQMIVSPKKHSAYFERITEKEKWTLAEAFKESLIRLSKALGDPAYNFYLHTAPCDGKNYDYYHWHWTIVPKTGIWAGFEIGTRMEISTIEPEKAAQYLRKQ